MNLAFFPSRAITWYMARKFLLTSLSVLGALVLVLMTLDLLGESGDILAHPGNGSAELWRYIGLRLPQIVQRFLPFAVLLGTLICFAGLNQNSEIISMKAAGISAHQILAPLILASFGIAIISFAFNDRIVARSTAALSVWQAADYGAVPRDSGIVSNVWVRDGDDLIHVDAVSDKGGAARLSGVSVYDRDGGRLLSVLTAPVGRRMGSGWQVTKARRFDVAAGKVTILPSAIIGQGITPDRFTLADVDPDGRSFGALSAAIDELQKAGRPVGALKSVLWHKISGPLSSILMPLLAAVAAFGLARSGRLFLRLVIGMGLGFAYFVADNFALAMGNLGAYPPLLAAWAPFVLFLLIGETILIRTEE